MLGITSALYHSYKDAEDRKTCIKELFAELDPPDFLDLATLINVKEMLNKDPESEDHVPREEMFCVLFRQLWKDGELT